MTQQMQVLDGHVITIRRPNGVVEQSHMRVWGAEVIPAAKFAAIVKATRDAGRGDVLSQAPAYRTANIPQASAADLAAAKYFADRASIERMSATGRA